MNHITAVGSISLSLLFSGCTFPFLWIERVPIASVTGRVIDRQTHRAVSGASVAIVGRPKTATTSDENGRFATHPSRGIQVSLLSCCYTPMTYRVRATHPEYAPTTIHWERPGLLGNYHTPFFHVDDIKLAPSPEYSTR